MDGQAATRERWADIEKKREYLGLRWADLARRAEVSQVTLYHYRHGRRPSDRILARLEAVLASLCAPDTAAEAAE